MIRPVLVALAAIVLFTTDSFSQKRQVIKNVTVIDVTGNNPVQAISNVIIEDGRIKSIGSAEKITKDMQVIDGQGKFLIPGLWDMHTHLSYYGENALEMLVANGVTGVRDMGGDLVQLDQWRKEIGEGKKNGPVIFRAGPFVDGPKNMDAQRKSFTKFATTAEEGRAVVHELKKMGVDFIKIHSRVSREAFFAIAKEAKKINLPLMVHAPSKVTVAEIAVAGVRCIEHTESLLGEAIYEKNDAKRDSLTDKAFQLLDSEEGRAIFRKIKESGSYYDPTLVSLYKLKGTAYEQQLGPRLLPIVSKLHEAGIPLLTGSDFAIPEAGIVPGIDLHDELALFVDAGLTPLEALQAATINPAKCLNAQGSLGSIEPGKRANLVLLNANPLENIRNTRKINTVFVNGKVIHP